MEIREASSASGQVCPADSRGEDATGYQPIENYGVIGDMHTAALVGMDGSIDWLCLPRFDSPSVFAAILDDEKGGRFKISPPRGELTAKQLYWPDTNVLGHALLLPDGVGEVDGLHAGRRRRGGRTAARSCAASRWFAGR